jgi:NAD(P)H-flavin reductase
MAQKDVFLPQMATVLDNRPMTQAENHFRFRLPPAACSPYLPGQFMEVSVPGIGEAPISICSSPTRTGDAEFEMVVRRVGRVTRALHALQPGDTVGIRGPFGTHFPVDGALRHRDLLFVCGGIGLVPMHSAIQYVLDRRDDHGKVTILFGTRSPADRLFTDELLEWKVRDDVTFLETVDRADPSWGGSVGVITSLFSRIQVDPARTTAVICGPPIMYRFVLLELQKFGLANSHIYMSLERHMKCGVGKCGHCQINHMYTCIDGPSFSYSEIKNLEEAL